MNMDDILEEFAGYMVDVFDIALMAFMVIMSLEAFKYLRHAVGLDDPLKDLKPNRKELAAMNREAMWDNYHSLREETADRQFDSIMQDRHEDSLRAEGRLVSADPLHFETEEKSELYEWTARDSEDEQEYRSMRAEHGWVNPNFNPDYQFTDEDREAEKKKSAPGKD